MTTRRADAEDLVQETILRAYLRFDTFQAGSNVRAWLRKIMFNLMIDTHRTTKRRPPEDLIGCMSSEAADFIDRFRPEVRSAEDHVIDALSGDVAKAVRALPDDLRLTVYYADVLGYRNTEIAEMMAIPTGTVASRLYRARKQLRGELESQFDDQALPGLERPNPSV
ncbi:RNA polymerase sigma factor [Mycolicibacterium frederiksbergense]